MDGCFPDERQSHERRHASLVRVPLLRSTDAAAEPYRRRRGGPGIAGKLKSRQTELMVGLRDVMDACCGSVLRLWTSKDAARGHGAS